MTKHHVIVLAPQHWDLQSHVRVLILQCCMFSFAYSGISNPVASKPVAGSMWDVLFVMARRHDSHSQCGGSWYSSFREQFMCLATLYYTQLHGTFFMIISHFIEGFGSHFQLSQSKIFRKIEDSINLLSDSCKAVMMS